MATIIDFQAALNQRRVAAKTAETEQRREQRVEQKITQALDAYAAGDYLTALTAANQAKQISKPEHRPLPAYCDPANEFRGSKYEANSEKPLTELAKLMRQDIKAAQRRGQLPKGLRVSVRCRHHTSIDINISDLPEGQNLYNPEYVRWTGNFQHPPEWPDDIRCDWRYATVNDIPGGMYTAEVDRWVEVLREIHRAYNRDNSDSMTDYFDVNYYGSVGIQWEFDADRREKEKLNN